MKKEYFNPQGIAEPRGYTHVVKVTGPGSLVCISGQVPLDGKGEIVGRGDIEKQVRQVFTNLETALASAGAGFKDVVKMTAYMLNIAGGLDTYRKVRLEYLGNAQTPANTLVEVKRLANPDYLIEIEAIAAQDQTPVDRC
jgi:enamine deaminase RidA (YjgF/YER057c/UK114 family)